MEHGADSREISRILRAAEAGEPVDMDAFLPLESTRFRRRPWSTKPT